MMAAPFTVHADLIGRLAKVLHAQHVDNLLPGLLTVLHGHLADTPADPRAVAYIDLALVRQVARLLGTDKPVELLLGVLAEVGPHLAQPSDGPPDPPPADVALSQREFQVLDGMSRGRHNGAIARGLSLSEDTVKTHARRLFVKLNAHDRAHAVARGYQLGVLRLPVNAGAA